MWQVCLIHWNLFSGKNFSRLLGKNIVPVHKKTAKIYWKIIPVFAESFEQLIFNDLFRHLITNELFENFQSGILIGNSYISQLLSILHETNLSLECSHGINIWDVFLGIFEAFNNIWLQGLIFKLKSYKVKGYLNLMTILLIIINNSC